MPGIVKDYEKKIHVCLGAITLFLEYSISVPNEPVILKIYVSISPLKSYF